MSRYSEYQQMSAAVVAAIKHAWPDARAKRVAAALGCSVITGKRIASTGKVSSRRRTTLLRILDCAIERNEAELRRLREELKLHEFTEARKVAASAAGTMGPTP
jgi:sensor c-di-GMP phosphodiesterase-like protein